MKHVNILQSIEDPARGYVGLTGDLRARVRKHDAGHVAHASKYGSWRVRTYFGSNDRGRAIFERCLKAASGRAFTRKRL
ncbi:MULTISPECIES: GIY-YIG nuclease family protein [Phenylobacterium]|uniref:GIY-YIG nuclease family protein n=1 Tax=Phenylobacterium TaxID=20 RepID=UPI00339AC20E